MNEQELARRALLRLAPLTDEERAQIAAYRPTPAAPCIVVRDAPQDIPLLTRAYPHHTLIHVIREAAPQPTD